MDYSQADLLNPLWWKRVRWTCDAIERTQLTKLFEMQWHRLSHSYSQLTSADARQTNWEQSHEVFQNLAHSLMPYLFHATTVRDQEQVLRDSARRLEQAWAEEFGDPKDPEVQKQIAATAKMLTTQPNESTMPEDE